MSTPDEMRRMFDAVLVSPPPDTTDIDAAMRAGRRRRRRRPTVVLLSLSAVVVAAGVVVASAWTTSAPQPPSAAPSTHTARSPAMNDGRPVTAAAELLGTWRTVQLDGQDVSGAMGVNGQPLTVRFGDDEGGPWWGATDGCNETSGRVTIAPAGHFSAMAEVTTAAGCVTEYPRNPAAVLAADEARITDATSGEPRRLTLVSGGKAVAVFTYQSDPIAP